MEKVQTIFVDFGVLGEEVEVHVTAEYDPGQVGSVEEGRKMEPDFEAGWVITDLSCPLVPLLPELYAQDEYVREKIDEAFEEQQ